MANINGGAVPASTPFLGSNGSQQLVAATPLAFTSLSIVSSALAWNANSQVYANAKATLTHSANTTLNLSGMASGLYFTLIVAQDSTGGNVLQFGTGCTWYIGTNSGFTANTVPALSASANAVNILAASYDGSNCYVNVR